MALRVTLKSSEFLYKSSIFETVWGGTVKSKRKSLEIKQKEKKRGELEYQVMFEVNLDFYLFSYHWHRLYIYYSVPFISDGIRFVFCETEPSENL